MGFHGNPVKATPRTISRAVQPTARAATRGQPGRIQRAKAQARAKYIARYADAPTRVGGMSQA